MPDELIPDFDRLAQALDALVRDHFAYFRLQTGRVVAAELFGGRVDVMRAQLQRRDGVVHAFAVAKAEQLHDLGLNEATLTESLHCWAIVEALDGPLVERLRYSHLVELIRAPDDPSRRLLAQAAVDNRWNRRALHDAVDDVLAGEWPDKAPEEPGMQPGPPEKAPPEVKVLAPGRVVTRLEKTVEAMDEMTSHLAGIASGDLAPGQRKRAKAALRKLRERVVALEKQLG